MPEVSVIIPTYNRAGFVVEAVNSVLSQTFDDLEVVVVNDGSSDETARVLENFNDPRVKPIHQANAGRSTARNRGFAESSGQFIVFLDDDDLFLPEKLEKQVNFLRENPDTGLVASGFNFVEADGQIIQIFRPWKHVPVLGWRSCIIEFGALHLSAVLIRRAALQHMGVLFQNGQEVFEDTDFFFRLSLTDCQMAWLKEIVCSYRLHDTNTVGSFGGEEFRKIVGKVLPAWFAREDVPPEMRAEKVQIEAYFDLYSGLLAYGHAETEAGQRLLASALTACPEWETTVFPEAVARFVGYLHADPRIMIERVFGRLPEEYAHLAGLKREAYQSFLSKVVNAAQEGEGPLGEPR
ncbi:MAG: glycosyltransferase family 2 protein [Candidatus Hydrogenedentales bacterium]|jgi:glycosyltransferase involved in cell wall biosynthesis